MAARPSTTFVKSTRWTV